MGMQTELLITREPIDEGALVARRGMSAGMGAAVYFAG
ncbi:MAG TPA: molybdenum cofactor biosynthesis protein MoaE, partial [Verrucomicrobiales bacterium]|nr:molybdenum cofactor biosynthesis protein MoaE [Verrucomicrobiales bacterium]